ncbi:MAG: SGNH/GDSL hydrolase family protein [Lentisphaerae bacterium]|nr:SGNH/GDSL hydrolase family protein [Lentisphaerota bacterium]
MREIDLFANFDLFRGAVAPFVRMNDRMIAFYSDTEVRTQRAKCVSGVRLLFAADAEKLEFEVQYSYFAREVFGTDVMVDGKCFTFDGAGVHQLALGSGKKQIEIHLPHLVILDKFSLKVNDEAVVETLPASARKLLFCGDSIFQGMTCSSAAKTLAAKTADALQMDWLNVSVGGAIMDPDGVEAALFSAGKDDVILMNYGINDAFKDIPLDVFRERTGRTMELLSRFSGQAVFVTPIYCATVDAKKKNLYRDIIFEEQLKYPKNYVINGDEIFPADEKLLIDGVHPNDQGMQAYAEGLTGALKKIIR